MELGKRLKKVAGLILPSDKLADVGCDHGYLSVYLIEKQICKYVIAMDVNKGPLQKAEENIRRFGYKDYIETRLSNGLNKLNINEAEGYICAGMGGPLALEILWNDRDKVKEMRQVILQPQSELWLVRRTLKQWGFVIDKEDIEFEDGKYYFMMRIRPGNELCMDVAPDENAVFPGEDFAVAINGSEMNCTDEEILKTAVYELFAKELLDEHNEILKEYICKEENRLLSIFKSLSKQEDSAKCRERKAAIEKELAIHQWALKQYET